MAALPCARVARRRRAPAPRAPRPLLGVLGGVLWACQGGAGAGARVEAIAGGEPSAEPAVVLVSGADGTLCTGTLVAANVVLTAKHCVQASSEPGPVAPGERVVGVGDAFERLTAVHDVRRIFAPPGVYLGGGPAGIGEGIEGDDVALLVLAEPTSVAPLSIRVAAPTDLVGASGRAVGFGRTPAGESGLERSVAVTIAEVRERTLVTGASTCPGDSGGPLLGPDGDVVGVSSFQLGTCGAGSSHFNRLDVHADLVAAAMADAGSCAATGAEVCNGADDDCNGRVDETCAPLGAPCAADDECARLGLCQDTPAGRLCTLACDPMRPAFGCGPGLYCASLGFCQGRCLPGVSGLGGPGASCADDLECASLLCVDPGDGARRCALPCVGDAGMCRGGEVCAAGVLDCGGCVTGGYAGPRGLGEPCDEDAQCHSLVCGEDHGVRYCSRFCDADDVCGGGFHCRSGECVRGERSASGGTCAVDHDCRDGLACADVGGVGFCTAGCGGDADCPPGFVCGPTSIGQACVPERALLGETCAGAAECISGLCADTTDGMVCVQRCGQDAPCPPLFACVAPADGSPPVCVRPRPSPAPEEGGCAVSGAPRAGGRLALLAALVGLSLAAARRRRRRRGPEPPRP